ncbi:MAG: hypothetical protein CL570_06730 [Alphaproteobacteria bacterium]|nr:hypothetical protein [Alphaproteobacteria bacterium]
MNILKKSLCTAALIGAFQVTATAADQPENKAHTPEPTSLSQLCKAFTTTTEDMYAKYVQRAKEQGTDAKSYEDFISQDLNAGDALKQCQNSDTEKPQDQQKEAPKHHKPRDAAQLFYV